MSPESLAIRDRSTRWSWCSSAASTSVLGPLIGSAAFTWMQDALPRATEYWRAIMGVVILALALAFPAGVAGAVSALRRRGSA